MNKETEVRERINTKSERAEEVANWFFRLNGFLSIPNFIVHPDTVSRHPRTEADYLQ